MWGSPHRFRPSILWQEKAVQRVCIMDFAALPVILFALLMIAAGVGDMLSRRIPNLLTLTIAVGFFPSAWVAGMAWGMIALNGVIGFVLLLAGFALFSLRLFGGGDAKLIAAAGTWFGVQGLGHFLTMTGFAGGLLAGLPAEAKVEAVATVQGGEIVVQTLSRVEATGVWRLVLDVRPEPGATVELGAHVAGYGRKLTEHWLCQWVTE